MNQGFKLRFDQLRENDPSSSSKQEDGLDGQDYYTNLDHTRSLCLIWLDGRRAFFNYSYLITGEFTVDNDENLIKLNFSTCTVTVRGYGLESLFMSLMDHLVRFIKLIDQRYALCDDHPNVIHINVEEKDP